MRSLQGQFSADIDRLLQGVIRLRVDVESSLDFPEDKEVTDMDHVLQQFESCLQITEQISGRAERGAMLSQGQRAVIMGSPNVGKSTLFNRLVGTDAAITSHAAGTTRDLLERTVSVAGAPLTIMDTAGLRRSLDDVEQQGMQRAIKAGSMADIILLVLEQDQQAQEVLSVELQQLPGVSLDGHTGHTICIRNKIDLADQAEVLLAKNAQQQDVYISASTGLGVDHLLQRLAEVMGLGDGGEDSYMARSRHLEALNQVRQCLLQGTQQLKQQGTLELVAEELRLAQQELDKISGRFVADDLLAEIFSTFCIGK
jgi:tRNA modification GTPase